MSTQADTPTAIVKKGNRRNWKISKTKLNIRHPIPNISVKKKDPYTVNQHAVMSPSHMWTLPQPKSRSQRNQVSGLIILSVPKKQPGCPSHMSIQATSTCIPFILARQTHLEAAALQATLFHLFEGRESSSHSLHYLTTTGSLFYDISL